MVKPPCLCPGLSPWALALLCGWRTLAPLLGMHRPRGSGRKCSKEERAGWTLPVTVLSRNRTHPLCSGDLFHLTKRRLWGDWIIRANMVLKK